MTKPLCIYHSNCTDGFTSAWVCNKFFQGEVDFHAASYGDLPPAVSGRHVVILDFSYPAETLLLLGSMSNGVLVLDHHKTAEQELKPFVKPFPDWQKRAEGSGAPGLFTKDEITNVRAHFDMERAGCGLAWDYFFPDLHRPLLVDFAEDRDLWRFKYGESRPVHAVLNSYKASFETWDIIEQRLHEDTHEVLLEGEAIDRAHLRRCYDVIGAGRAMVEIDGFRVPCCNAPFHMASDIGNLMSEGHPFAMTYVDDPKGRRAYSLRSQPDGEDVSLIAQRHGGGGHRNAAGFTTTAPTVIFTAAQK